MTTRTRRKHDILFKDVFSHKAMVASFVRAFVDESLAKQLKLDTGGNFFTKTTSRRWP